MVEDPRGDIALALGQACHGVVEVGPYDRFRAPEGIDSGELVLTLRDRFGITLAPGQGPLKGKVFRIGHIGWFDVFDITTALAAVELVLADAGAQIERGASVTRALEAWAEHTPV